jgi:hypothetical protein
MAKAKATTKAAPAERAPEIEGEVEKVTEADAKPADAEPARTRRGASPSVGDGLVYRAPAGETWGEVTFAPGLVQRVHSETCVDLIAFPAGHSGPVVRKSVELGETEPGTWSPRG